MTNAIEPISCEICGSAAEAVECSLKGFRTCRMCYDAWSAQSVSSPRDWKSRFRQKHFAKHASQVGARTTGKLTTAQCYVLAVLGSMAFFVSITIAGLRSENTAAGRDIQTEVLRGSDDGRAWLAASTAMRRSLCADIERRTGVDASFIYDGLDTCFHDAEPIVLNQKIAEVVALISAAGGR